MSIEMETATIVKQREYNMAVTLEDDHVIHIKAPGARFTFDTVDEFRTFLKMLMRFDERL